MASDEKRIDEPVVARDSQGRIKSVRLVFGPHHFVDVYLEDGRVKCAIGATHHGIRADGGEVNSELEGLVAELRRAHPENSF